MASYGLMVTDTETKVPLKDISVKVHIVGFIANVKSKLTYRNDETNPIEATFVFPLDALSAIYKFEAVVEGRLIVGECQDKSQAQQTYQDAIEAGKSAFLLEESDASGDVFECLVGNIPPDTEVEITFSYALELAVLRDGRVKFVYPAVLGPRYGVPVENTASASAVLTSRSGAKRLKTAKGPKLTYIDSEDISYTFHFEAEVECPLGIVAVSIEDGANRSEFTTEVSGKAQNWWNLKLNTDEHKYHFDYDIELVAKYTKPFQPAVILEKGNPNKDGILKKDVVMLNFCPKLEEAGASTSRARHRVQTGEFVFVVDRSGSMGGDRIKSAKEALGKFLETLPADCYFNIISFGSSFDALFTQGSLKNSKDTMKRAVALQEGLQANYGGTEMVNPFKHLYSWIPVKGYQRQVFLLTDGCIWNTPELIKLVKENAHTTRVFAFGIGHGASTALVKGVARAGGGKAEFITDKLAELPEKVSYILSRAQQPYVSDVQLEWKTPAGLTVTTLPEHIPPVFFGEKLLVYGVINVGENCKAKSQYQCKAVLKGNMGKEKLLYTLDFVIGGDRVKSKTSSNNQDVDEAMSIHRLAAKAQIKELEDDEAGEGNKPQITLLSTSANVVSKYTAFVGVDHGRKDKITGDMEVRDVPLAELRKTKVPRPPPPQAGPSFYGGGSSDCPLVDKYINGKTVSAIPDVKVGEFVLILDQNDVEDVTAAADLNAVHDNELTEDVDQKPPPRKRAKFTHVKEHKAAIPLVQLRYAPWTDGYSYPVEKIADLPNRGRNRPMVRVKFCDGKCKVVPEDSIVSAAKFSAGDIVLVKNAPNRYKFAVVLEYSKEDDGLIVACKDGLVCRFQAHYLVIPKATAVNMKSRDRSSLTPVMMCTVPLLPSWGQDHLKITTSDLSELNLEGWINETIVQFSLARKWTKLLSEEQRRTISFFSPLFYHTLSQELVGRKKYTRQTEKGARFEVSRRWTESVGELASRQWLFVPIFDEIHWYVIAIKLNKEWEGDDQCVKFHYIVMDSYFTADRAYEIMLIHNFLSQVCKDQGLIINSKSRTTYPPVPVQENLSDCGICMLLCIDKCFEDGLDPAPHLTWWSPEEPDRKRQQIAEDVMELWLEQSTM